MSVERVPFEQSDEYLIDTIDKLRVVANPLRLQIIDCLIHEAHTVKEIGDRLGIKSNTLYYHVSELESVGMVQLVDAVVISGIQNKYYRATARYFRLLSSLLYVDGDPIGGADFLASTVEGTARDLRTAAASGTVERHPELLRITQRTIWTTPDRVAAIRKRLGDIERDFVQLNEPDGPVRVEMQFALFPHADTARPRRS
ncbi:MAG: helix-turn-helix domain-containing protein [Thermomicrobiales bacterium]|nr:helix-turn-helix domain-containing protein [Thermomicrobiales bacterium]